MFASKSLAARCRASVPRRFAGGSKGSYWMPFTDNVMFNDKPKILEKAGGENGCYYYTEDGREILDGFSGLWCVNAGHNQTQIYDAISAQLKKMDYAPSFNSSHRGAEQFADKLLELLPNRGFEKVFFTICGSSSVDSALKMALAYHKARGNGSKCRFVGREKGYHGVGFGGVAVGGMVGNRKMFGGNMLPLIDHVSHTHSLEHMAFSRGQPQWGAHLAEDLERVIALHDASNIAAFIIEPVHGSAGVIPPPVGYLERVREICTKHDILLIFDEVITGFGRLGASFGTEKFNVTPDIITCAKGLTNGIVPAGAVIAQGKIFDALAKATHASPGQIPEFFHGYTYSGHPMAMAAGLATLKVYEEQNVFQRCSELSSYFEDGLHALKSLPHVVDCRNMGFMGAIEFAPVPGAVNFTRRAHDIYERAFEKGVMLRYVGSSVTMCPPLVASKKQLDELFSKLAAAIEESAAIAHTLPLCPENEIFVSYSKQA